MVSNNNKIMAYTHMIRDFEEVDLYMIKSDNVDVIKICEYNNQYITGVQIDNYKKDIQSVFVFEDDLEKGEIIYNYFSNIGSNVDLIIDNFIGLDFFNNEISKLESSLK